MAELDVEPKKKSSILPWIIGALVLLLILFFLFKGCNNDKTDAATVDSTNTSSTTTDAAGTTAAAATDWSDVDVDNAPSASFDEITDTSINVRGNDKYGVYGLGEDVLFDEGKATIRSSAAANLEQIAGSIQKRYNGGNVRLYGYTDASGSAGANKELAQQRVQAVRDWLVSNGNITDGNLSLHPIGEAQPAASNSTEAGRQLNRRVEIVAKGSPKGE